MIGLSKRNLHSVSRRRLPPLKERFLPLFSEAEHETLHPDLYTNLIDSGTDLIIQQLKEYSARRKSLLKDLRGRITIKRLRNRENAANSRVVASDAGNNGVDLRSAFIPLYASAAIVVEGWAILDEPIFKVGESQIWPDEHRSRDRESLLASKLQFEVTLDAIERWKPKYVLFDGSLLINFWLLPAIFGSTKEYKRGFDLAVAQSIRLLHFCYGRDLPIIGFVKRTRMNEICARLGFPKMRDTALLDMMLNLGEFTEPIALSANGAVIKAYRRKSLNLGISESESKKFLDIYFSYIKTGFTTPFRLEIPEYCLDRLEDVATLIFSTSEEDGIPFAINEADSLTKITTSISNICTLMIYSKALELVRKGEMEPEDLNLLSLQHGEPWVLRDGEQFGVSEEEV